MEFRKIELRDCEKKVVGIALVSVKDYGNVNKYKWSMWKSKNGKRNYARGCVNGKTIMMHQLIMGPPPNKKLVIDHMNNNGLDNQRTNLQFSSRSGNNQNKKKKENTKNKFIGVYKVNDRFVVEQGGKNLGTFTDEIDAAKHYDKYVRIKYNGTGTTNFPVSLEDIEGVKLEDLILTKKEKLSGLPEYIFKSRNKYFARRVHQGKSYKSCNVSTIGEAIVELRKYNKIIEELEEKFIKEHYEKPIERNESNQAIINIYSNKKAYECIVDDEHWHELTLHKWNMSNDYVTTAINRKHCSMHTYLMAKVQTNTDRIDHINRNPLDNRMCNLRSVDAGTNAHNKSKREGCTSEYIGVSKEGKKWRAKISFGNTQQNLGLFINEIDAAKAYNKKATEVYKQNANLNII